jgi:membrane protein
MKDAVKFEADSHNDGHFFRAVVAKWVDDNAVLMAAGLSYFGIFALAPSLFIVITIASLALGKMAAEKEVLTQLDVFMGPDVAHLVGGVIQSIHISGAGKTAVFGIFFLLIGATGLFVQLKAALNHIWNVSPVRGSFWRRHLKNRLRGIFLLLTAGVLFLLFFSVNAGAWIFYHHIAPYVPRLAGQGLGGLRALNTLTTFAAVTVFAGMVFRYLPDAKIKWSEVWRGSLATGSLMMLGIYTVGLYLAHANLRSIFGVAGTLVALLIWFYASALIFLLGAEITWAIGRKHRRDAQPSAN